MEQKTESAVRYGYIASAIGAYLVAASAVVWFYAQRGDVPVPYAAAGILWASLYRARRAEYLVLLVGACAVQMTVDQYFYNATASLSLVFALSKTTEAAVGVALVSQLGRRERDSRVAAVGRFIIISVIVLPALCAVAPAWARTVEQGDFLTDWAQWSLVQSAGVLLLAPAALALPELQAVARALRRRWREYGTLWISALLMLHAVFTADWISHPGRIYLALPLLFLLSARFGTPGAIPANLFLAIFANAGQIMGSALFFPTESLQDIGASLCLFLIVVAAATLWIGAAADDQARHTKTISEGEKALQKLSIQSNRAFEKSRFETATLVHDALGQVLALSRIKIDALLGRLRDRPDAVTALMEVNDHLNDMIGVTRSITSGVAASYYRGGNLAGAIDLLVVDLISEEKFDVECNIGPLPPIDSVITANLYRCIRELLINAIKHSSATRIALDVYCRDNRLSVRVSDNGVGFTAASLQTRTTADEGFGLQNIKYTIAAMGGGMGIESESGSGASILLEVPLAAAANDSA